METDLRVLKQSADVDKDKYIVVLKGITGDSIEIEVKLTGKTDDVLDTFPRMTVWGFALGDPKQTRIA